MLLSNIITINPMRDETRVGLAPVVFDLDDGENSVDLGVGTGQSAGNKSVFGLDWM